MSVGVQLGKTEEESLAEFTAIVESVDTVLYEEDEEGREESDGYKYRFQERLIKESVKHSIINKKGSPVRRINAQEDKRYDLRRTDAPHADHDKPAKSIQGK